MKIKTQVKQDGAKCTLSITVDGKEIATRFNTKLAEVASQARISGFRPGKSPIKLIKKRYGESVLGETIEKMMQDAVEKALNDNNLRPSMQPTADIKEKYEISSIDDEKDMDFTIEFEPLPDIELADFKSMKFEKLIAEPEEKDINESLENLAKSQVKEGEDVPKLDDEFAKKFGQDSFDDLKKLMIDNLADEIGQGSRTRLKMAVMDALDDAHKIAAPPTMVEREYDAIVQHAEREAQNHHHDENCDHEKDAPVTISDEEKAEFKEIASRRVRIGLVLAEIAQKNNLSISNTELQQAVVARAKSFPGHEEQMYNMIVGNPNMLENVRAPLLEDKAVDFILELAQVEDVKSSTDEIFKQDEDEEKKPAAKKKAATKKAPAKKATAKKSPAKKAPAKKPAAAKKENKEK